MILRKAKIDSAMLRKCVLAPEAASDLRGMVTVSRARLKSPLNVKR